MDHVARRDAIERLLVNRRRRSVREIAEAVGSNPALVRHDLRRLEREGRIELLHDDSGSLSAWMPRYVAVDVWVEVVTDRLTARRGDRLVLVEEIIEEAARLRLPLSDDDVVSSTRRLSKSGRLETLDGDEALEVAVGAFGIAVSERDLGRADRVANLAFRLAERITR
jgi:hypothetical protein